MRIPDSLTVGGLQAAVTAVHRPSLFRGAAFSAWVVAPVLDNAAAAAAVHAVRAALGGGACAAAWSDGDQDCLVECDDHADDVLGSAVLETCERLGAAYALVVAVRLHVAFPALDLGLAAVGVRRVPISLALCTLALRKARIVHDPDGNDPPDFRGDEGGTGHNDRALVAVGGGTTALVLPRLAAAPAHDAGSWLDVRHTS